MCDHHHHHDGCSHSKDSDDVTIEAGDGTRYMLNKYVDLNKVVCLNEAIDESGRTVIKDWEMRLDRSMYVDSDCDAELLFHIPFTAHVKITGIIVSSDATESHPSHMRLYRDRPTMTFDDVRSEPDQEMALEMDPQARIDYPLRAAKFSNVHQLSIHFPTNFGAESTRIHYIGLRGEFVHDIRRQQVVIATYEARAIPQDHRGEINDTVGYDVY